MKQILESLKQQKQQQEAEEALLQKNYTEDPLKQREVVVKIDNEICCGEVTEGSDRNTPGSSRKLQLSFEQLTEAVLQKRKNSQLSSGSDTEGLFRTSSRYYDRKNSWRLLVDKTKKSRLIDPSDDDSDELLEDKEDNGIEDIPEEYRKSKFNILTVLQWMSLLLIIIALVCTLRIHEIKKQKILDLPYWKWEILALAVVCGRLISGWAIRIAVIIIERCFLLRKRVLYFVYGLRRAVQNCLWLGLVLLVWRCIFDEQLSDSKFLPYVRRILVCFFVGAVIWLLKTFIVKIFASSFHVNTFFERIHDALFNQYIIDTLSRSPSFEPTVSETQDQKAQKNLELQGNGKLQRCPTVGRKPSRSTTISKKQSEEFRIDHLHKLNQKNISAWNMKRMINIVRHGCLSTLDEQVSNCEVEDESLMAIRSECKAKEAAEKIFKKVAKPGSSSISFEDLLCFMGKEEAEKTMKLIGVCKDEEISKLALNNWLVNAFKERKALTLSLNDTKTAVDDLHSMLNIVVSVIIAIIWLVILGVQVTHFLVFLSSQLLLAVFVFGNSCKTVFEAIIFLFVMHPYDVGDRCEIDGVQLIVEEMNILTTVFLRCTDNQKIRYPNSILSTKPIGNFFRSPDMVETINFSIHILTPIEKIYAIRRRITQYIADNIEDWHQPPGVAVGDLEEMNRLNMVVSAKHKSNFQDMGNRYDRRNKLVEELIHVLQDLEIQYRMPPVDVNIEKFPALVSNDRLV